MTMDAKMHLLDSTRRTGRKRSGVALILTIVILVVLSTVCYADCACQCSSGGRST